MALIATLAILELPVKLHGSSLLLHVLAPLTVTPAYRRLGRVRTLQSFGIYLEHPVRVILTSTSEVAAQALSAQSLHFITPLVTDTFDLASKLQESLLDGFLDAN